MVPLNHSRRIAGKRFRVSAFTRLELDVAVVIVLLVVVSLGVKKAGLGSHTLENPRWVKDLSNARLIGIALRLYAEDHGGSFPDKTVDGGELSNANEAYCNLFDYLDTKRMFLADSAWSPGPLGREPTKKRVLAGGENGFAYVPQLTEKSNSNFPLVASGFKEGQPGVYASDPKAKGGLRWGMAIVIHVDGSGRANEVDPADGKVYRPTANAAHADIFAPAPGWLEPKNKPLNPASK